MLLTIGKLISTTDLNLAARLNETINVSDITNGQRPSWFSQVGGTLALMVAGEYYEVAA